MVAAQNCQQKLQLLLLSAFTFISQILCILRPGGLSSVFNGSNNGSSAACRNMDLTISSRVCLKSRETPWGCCLFHFSLSLE